MLTKFDSIAHDDCIFWPYGKYLHDKVAHVLKHSQPSEISLDQTYVIQFGFMQKWTEVYIYIYIYCSFDSISSPVIPPWIKLFKRSLLKILKFNEKKLIFWSIY